MILIVVAVSLCMIACLTSVSISGTKMRKIISEPSLAAFAVRKFSPSFSSRRKNKSSTSIRTAGLAQPPYPPVSKCPSEASINEHHEELNCSLSLEAVSAEPLRCSSNHEGKELMNIVLPVSVDTAFNLLFTASKFNLDFLALQKTYDINLGQWKEGKNKGEKTRKCSFTITLNNPLGPKTALCTQEQ
ncbi:unnamed protein product, partial [Darwinula stevensoni]